MWILGANALGAELFFMSLLVGPVITYFVLFGGVNESLSWPLCGRR